MWVDTRRVGAVTTFGASMTARSQPIAFVAAVIATGSKCLEMTTIAVTPVHD